MKGACGPAEGQAGEAAASSARCAAGVGGREGCKQTDLAPRTWPSSPAMTAMVAPAAAEVGRGAGRRAADAAGDDGGRAPRHPLPRLPPPAAAADARGGVHVRASCGGTTRTTQHLR